MPPRFNWPSLKSALALRVRQVREDPGGDIPATPGKVIELTLDVDVQLRAEEVFGAESGAAVVMDCRSGDILCMFSGPSFDATANEVAIESLEIAHEGVTLA